MPQTASPRPSSVSATRPETRVLSAAAEATLSPPIAVPILETLHPRPSKSAPPRVRAELVRAPREFVDLWQEIQGLRRSLGVADDVLLDPAHFLSATDAKRQSCSVACWEGPKLIGLLYATEHCVAGIRTGYAIGGDFVGRGLLLCAAEDEFAVLKNAVAALAASGIHSLHLRLQPRIAAKLDFPGLRLRYLERTIPGDRMQLRPTFEEFLATLGRHTRRNIRNSMRKAESAGMQFVPRLSGEQYRAAVAVLNAASAFRADPARLARDERLLAFHSGAQRFGLRAADGAMVAVLCGFAKGGRFHLLTQLNDARLESLSLSAVLRGHLIRELIAMGLAELQFMGGTSLAFGRFCQPLDYRSIYIDRKSGIAAAAKRLGNALVKLATLAGRPVPEKLAMMCGGELDRPKLIERTAVGIGGYPDDPE